jgi:hypothetical protein
MPAVISTLHPPDNLVTPYHRHHRVDSPTYWIALSALAVLFVVRLAPGALSSRTRLKPRGAERDRRKDYGRNALAPPSGFTGFPAGTGAGVAHKQRLPIWPLPVMEGSRGVSSSAADLTSQDDSPATGEETRSPSPPQSSADGADNEQTAMDSWAGSLGDAVSIEARRMVAGPASMDSGSFADFANPRSFMARPPPPPPLTPPTLSAGGFSFEDRRPSFAVSIPAELDAISPLSFIHQPNPDYGEESSSRDTAVSSPTTPRRRSYTKLVPIGIPAANPGVEASSKDTFAPSSFPSSAPVLPPPPPGHNHEALYAEADQQAELDLHGAIMSVVDDSGMGWKRHTRVYGGGVCLACMAAGGGGFYGDKVPEEHKRPGHWHHDGGSGSGSAS